MNSTRICLEQAYKVCNIVSTSSQFHFDIDLDLRRGSKRSIIKFRCGAV